MDEILTRSGYEEIPPLLNTTNEDLFIGTSNLHSAGRIESIRAFQKLMDSTARVNEVCGASDASDDGLVLIEDVSNGCSKSDAPESLPYRSNHLVVLFTLGRQLTSHVGIVHGGAIATLLDEFFVKAALPLTPDNFAVTALLEIKYLRPVRIQEGSSTVDVVLDCHVTENVENRKFTVVGVLRSVSGQRYCTGKILVVVPREKLL